MPLPIRRFSFIESVEFELMLAGPSNMLPENDGSIDLERLAGAPFISLDPFATYQESIEAVLGEAGVDVSYVCETSSVVTAAQLVRLGVGCAFLDPFIANTVRGSDIQVSNIRQKLTHSYGIYAPSRDSISREAAEFLETVRAQTALISDG